MEEIQHVPAPPVEYDSSQPQLSEENLKSNTDTSENMAGVAPYTADQNPVNGNSAEIQTSYQSTENGAALEQPYVDGVYSVEEERLWNLVKANCLDFNSWTALIDETERVAATDIMKIRKVYDAFLAEFPLCFGYWKKYADHEGRLSGVEKTVEVYERAVLAVTYSVEIWVNYCQFAIQTYDDPDIIRRLFERGLAYVGTDYRSDLLWDEYIRYEESQQAWKNLAIIYTKIFEHPIQQFDRYFNCFKELAASHPLSELKSPEETAGESVQTKSETGTNGTDESSTKPPGTESLPSESEELEKFIAIREEMFKKAKEFEYKIIGFESGVRRPYFHVKPLDEPELDNWHGYLDFIEKEADFNKVLKMYERCLIACANYPEFWIRYVIHMEDSGNLELANNALARATQVFVKKQPEIHLFGARFKEQIGDIEGARAEYQLIYTDISPGLLEAIVKHANMEYRLGEKESAFGIYEKEIAVEQAKEQSQLLPMLIVQYSRFLYLVDGNLEKAREILSGSIEQMQLSKPIIEAIIHLESISPSPKRIDLLNSLVEKFITPNEENPNSSTEREDLSCIFLEFLDLFGDLETIKKATKKHNILFSRQRSVLSTRKRSSDDSFSSDRAKRLKTGVDQSQTQAQVQSTYPAVQTQDPAQAQWTAGAYAQKAPAPAPTYPATYPPQAGYAAYGGAYAGYNQPATQAYGAYPTSYAPQAYPTQSVAPVTVPVTPAAPVQSTPAVQPPYYGGYYTT
ncbi:hypothetical protein LUZ60_014982 [Juncus effusus]|nr:hypothetical protein LUZ60_014982 [Juncus effusus]